MALEVFGGLVAHGLHRIPALDQRPPLGQQPLQFDRPDLGAVLFALAALLGVLIVVELALDPIGGAVEQVDRGPEQVFEVGIEAGVGQGRDKGVEDVGDGGADDVVLGQRPQIGLVHERAVAVAGHFFEGVGGGGLGVVGFEVGKFAVGSHGMGLFRIGRALRGLRRRRKTAGGPGPHPKGRSVSEGRRPRLCWCARNAGAAGRGRKP